MESLPKAYEQSHFSGYLYLASHIVRACGTEGSPHRPMVASAVTPMIQEACSRLATLGACNRRPHDTDDLFLMAYKGLAHSPSLFLGQAVLSNLLRVAAVGMLVQHQHAFQSIQSFMYRLLDVQTLSTAPERDQTQTMLKVRLLLGACWDPACLHCATGRPCCPITQFISPICAKLCILGVPYRSFS